LLMIKYLFYTCVFALSLGQLTVVYRMGESRVYLFDPLMALFAFVGFVYFLGIHKKLEIPRYFYLFLGFTLVAILSLAFKIGALEASELAVAGFYLLRWLVYLGAALVVYNLVSQNMMKLSEFLRVFLISGVFVAVAGFVQLILLPDFGVLDPSLGWDPHKNRLASTFFDPNFAGAYLTICLVLAAWAYEKSVIDKKSLVLVVLILLSALLLTFSRSSWGMAAVIVLIYGIFRYRLLLLMSLLLMLLAYFAVPRVQTRITGTTDPADSAHFRLISWKNTLDIAEDNLITGVGFNAFRYAQKEYGYLTPDTAGAHSGAGSDSSFLFVLATTGVFGFLLFAGGFLYRMVRNLQFRETGFLAVLAIFSGLLLHSQFVNALFYPQIMFLWLCLLGIPIYQATHK
jgi:O-antigen ligase